MKKLHVTIAVLLTLPTYHVNAKCHLKTYVGSDGMTYVDKDASADILFVVNNASDRWMYLWMGHPRHGEDNGNLNLKPHSSATTIGCSNGNGYMVTGIIVTQGKDVLYTFDVDKTRSKYKDGKVKMHTWKGGCYVAWSDTWYVRRRTIQWDMSRMKPDNKFGGGIWGGIARVRIDCV